MFASTHQLLNLLKVVSGTRILLLFRHDDSGAAVSMSHVLDEIGSIADRFTLESEDERAGPLVEAVRTA